MKKTFTLTKEEFDNLFTLLVYCEHNSSHKSEAKKLWTKLFLQGKQYKLFDIQS